MVSFPARSIAKDEMLIKEPPSSIVIDVGMIRKKRLAGSVINYLESDGKKDCKSHLNVESLRFPCNRS